MHVIRLRGPWQYEPLAHTVLLSDGTTQDETARPLPPSGRSHMPADWEQTMGADFRGRVRYTRAFGRPAGLEPAHRIYLVIESVDAWGQVWLNAQKLGPVRGSETARFEVTQRLDVRNRLTVEVELPRLTADSPPLPRPGREGFAAGGLVGEVRLEIDDSHLP